MSIVASVRNSIRVLICGAALLCAVSAAAQDFPAGKITTDDLRRALIWTGHYSVLAKGDAVAIYREAFQRWQKARGYAVTDTLPDEQMSELLAEGARQRDAFGWTTLEDKSVGFSVGVPAKLAKFVAAKAANGGLSYSFEGSVYYSVLVDYGDLSCSRLSNRYLSVLRRVRPFYVARSGSGFAVAARLGDRIAFGQAACRTSGAVFVEIQIPEERSGQLSPLLSAMAESLRLDRDFNPTAVPRPKVEQPTPTAGDLIVASATQPAGSAKPAAVNDNSGRTSGIKLEGRGPAELSVEQVFEKASAAVYMVKAGERLGSAVAIDDHELLTNCHVVKDKSRVALVRDGKEQTADVVSVNEKADRCVLRTSASMPSWVTVRPYDDIKVGERAVTIGTPQGLELTVAEGIVSSKRTYEGRRLVQTTAPISPGSSGGGLFDVQGHLLGITTFHLKVGQNLNFAVAGEDFATTGDAPKQP